MESLKLAHENLTSALERLNESIDHLEQCRKCESTKETMLTFMDNSKLERSLRDSLIQRFEFCTDLFWKYLKKYLELIVQITPDFNGPKPVIRAALKAGLLSETDAETLLKMIESRNMTSHIYKEEIADQISANIPMHYKIMHKYADSLMPQA
ncbi:nucleotidyltransferase substrate binding protein [bacterium]|nr:MAG: nucleotidyltransferase substrate binding protein [bacterium]